MKMMLIITAVGLLIASSPILYAVLGGLLGWDREDPSWGAALPFMLFITVPAGLVVTLVGWAVIFAYSMWG